MNASASKARRTVRARRAASALKASLRRGRSLATHAIAAGADADSVSGVVAGLRKAAAKLGMAPVRTVRTHRTTSGKESRTRRVGHWTSAQVALLAQAYKPRKAEYKLVAAVLAG